MKESKDQACGVSRRDVFHGPATMEVACFAFSHLSLDFAGTAESASRCDTKEPCDTKKMLDASTWDRKILQDWRPVGATRQQLIAIQYADGWPGAGSRIPFRMTVPLKGKAKGFHLTGAIPYAPLHECLQQRLSASRSRTCSTFG